MKTEVFSFNELNVDGNRDYAQIIIQVTGSDFDYPSILDHIQTLKRKTEDADRRFLRFPGRIFWGFFKKIPPKISDLEQVCLNLHKQGSRMFH